MLYPIYDSPLNGSPFDNEYYTFNNYATIHAVTDDIVTKNDYLNIYFRPIDIEPSDIRDFCYNNLIKDRFDTTPYVYLELQKTIPWSGNDSVKTCQVAYKQYDIDEFFITARQNNGKLSIYKKTDNTLFMEYPIYYLSSIDSVIKNAVNAYPSRSLSSINIAFRYRSKYDATENKKATTFYSDRVFVNNGFPKYASDGRDKPAYIYYTGTIPESEGIPPRAINPNGGTMYNSQNGVNVITGTSPQTLRSAMWIDNLDYNPALVSMTYPNFFPLTESGLGIPNNGYYPKYLSLNATQRRGQLIIKNKNGSVDNDTNANYFNELITCPNCTDYYGNEDANFAQYSYIDSFLPFFKYIYIRNMTLQNNKYVYQLEYEGFKWVYSCDIDISNSYAIALTSGYFKLNYLHKYDASVYFGSDNYIKPNTCRQVFTTTNAEHAKVNGRIYTANAKKSLINPYDEKAKTGGGCGSYGN